MTEMQLDIVDSLIGVAGAGFRLSLLLNAVGSQMANADSDIHGISKAISLFSLMLKQVGSTMREARHIVSQSAFETAAEIRDQSQLVLDEIKNMIDLSQGRDEYGQLQTIKLSERIKWCFKKHKVQYLLGQLESLKLSLAIMLQVLQMGKGIAARNDTSRSALTEKGMMQDRAEIQNMMVVQHWSLVDLRKLYNLAENEAREESSSPSLEDPPPKYDAQRLGDYNYGRDHSDGDIRLSIEPPPVPEKVPDTVEDSSRSVVLYNERPLHQLDASFTKALVRQNQVLSAPVYDIVDHLLSEWTCTHKLEAQTTPPKDREPPPRLHEHRQRTYYESDQDDSSDSEFDQLGELGPGGRYIEGPGPKRVSKKKVQFHASVESDPEDANRDRPKKRAPKKHLLHSEDDETSSDSSVSPPLSRPGSRRNSESTGHGHLDTHVPDTHDRRRTPYTSTPRNWGPENVSGRPSSRGGPSHPIPLPPRPGQPWQNAPPMPSLRPSQYNGPPGPPQLQRMPPNGQFIQPGYMGHSPQPQPSNYFPQRAPGPPAPPNSQPHHPRHRSHRTESRQNAAQKDKEASKNLKRGLFGGAAVAGIIDLLQALDGL